MYAYQPRFHERAWIRYGMDCLGLRNPNYEFPENRRGIISFGAYAGYEHHCTVVLVTR